MLKQSKILSQDVNPFLVVIAILLSSALVFGGIPSAAWADSFDDSTQKATNAELTDAISYEESSANAHEKDSISDVMGDVKKNAPSCQDTLKLSNVERDTVSEESASHPLIEERMAAASLFYIDEKVVAVGEEEKILFSFDDTIDADRFMLSYSKIDDSSEFLQEAEEVRVIDGETSALFSLSFTDAANVGDYRINSIAWYGTEEGIYEAPVSDDGVSFSVIESKGCDAGITITSLDEDGAVVERTEISEALEVADETVAADAAPQISALANSRALTNNPVIGLDPGHGGTDSGAVGGGVLEKDLNLRIALACRDRLRQQGARVVMTREDDRLLNVNQIAQIARDKGATVLVSFHINSATSASAKGYEVWVQNDHYRPDLSQESNALGQKVLDKLAQFGLADRGLKEDEASGPAYAYPDGSAGDYLSVLRNSKKLGMPSILIEHGFISNSSDRNIMHQRAEEMGRADAEAIIEYYQIGGRLVADSRGYRYQLADGSFLKNAFNEIGGNLYYFGSDSYAYVGRCEIQGSHYHFYSNGVAARGRWWNSRYYYGDGKEAKPGWLSVGADWYYIGSDGTYRRGRQQIDGDFYYFWSTGAMAKSKWWDGYYYQADGSMATNQWVGNIWVDGNGNIDLNANDAIMGQSKTTAAQMARAYIARVGADAYPYKGNADAPNIQAFCEALVREANSEGVRADVVFAQSMHETNWLQFGGDVKKEQFNFAGLGATGGGNPGNNFSSIPTGLLAQVQHLKAYASTDPLNRGCVDPRFEYVQRGCAPVIIWLGIPDNPYGKGWAAQKGYGNYITNYMKYVEQF